MKSKWIFVVSLIFSAACLLGCDKKAIWDEHVLLADGRTITVQRHEIVRPDAFFQPGRGPTKKIVFSIPTYKGLIDTPPKYPGTDITISNPPEILDFIDGDPVIVMGIGGELCAPYGNPQESLLAFRHQGNTWKRVSVSDLPADFALNIASSRHALRASEYQGMIDSIQTGTENRVPLNALISERAMQSFACGTSARIVSTQYRDNSKVIAQALIGIGSKPLSPPEPVRPSNSYDMRQLPGGTLITPSCDQMIDRVKNSGAGDSPPPGVHLQISLSGGNRQTIDIPQLDFRKSALRSMAIACGPPIAFVSTTTNQQGRTKTELLSVLVFDRHGRRHNMWHATLPGLADHQEYRVVAAGFGSDGILHATVKQHLFLDTEESISSMAKIYNFTVPACETCMEQ